MFGSSGIFTPDYPLVVNFRYKTRVISKNNFLKKFSALCAEEKKSEKWILLILTTTLFGKRTGNHQTISLKISLIFWQRSLETQRIAPLFGQKQKLFGIFSHKIPFSFYRKIKANITAPLIFSKFGQLGFHWCSLFCLKFRGRVVSLVVWSDCLISVLWIFIYYSKT